MSPVDVWRVTTELDDSTLDVLVRRLESRGRHPRFIRMMHDYLDAMDIDRTQNVAVRISAPVHRRGGGQRPIAEL